jgi:hydrogenase maturation protease
MKKKMVVLGLGNPLMADEGIGVRIIERFLASSDKYPDVDFIDAGTGGMAVLHLIAGRQKAVIIDCAYMQTPPGTIKKFGPDDIESIKTLTHLSLHEADVIKIIEMAKKLDLCPQKIVIFGIEPEYVRPQPRLSKIVASKMDDFLAAISEELSQ